MPETDRLLVAPGTRSKPCEEGLELSKDNDREAELSMEEDCLLVLESLEVISALWLVLMNESIDVAVCTSDTTSF
jgi:hypothetical protein